MVRLLLRTVLTTMPYRAEITLGECFRHYSLLWQMPIIPMTLLNQKQKQILLKLRRRNTLNFVLICPLSLASTNPSRSTSKLCRKYTAVIYKHLQHKATVLNINTFVLMTSKDHWLQLISCIEQNKQMIMNA